MTAISRRPDPTATETTGSNLRQNLRRLRHEREMTLDALAERSSVSRAMISKIERGVAVPTATILGKLAAGLEVGLSQLVGNSYPRKPTLLPCQEQAVYRDPESGLTRRSLSPLFPDRSVDFVLNTLPPGGRVVFPGHNYGIEEYLFVHRGCLTVVTGGQRHAVRQGDTLFYPAHDCHEFHNESDQTAEFFIIIDDTRMR
jgi:transcriptional regulator with XRE-family HTH domain